MRLTKQQISIIKTEIKQKDKEANIYLFGSRVDDTQRGGDIDILVHSQVIDKLKSRQIKWRLMELLGEQKIDFVVSKDLKEPFVQLIFPTSVQILK